jgi:hypothetical protein
MGRVTRSYRQRLKEERDRIRKVYREQLKDKEHQKALDGLWDAWGSEEGAMTNSGITDALKALLLTAVVDNRREIENLRLQIGQSD